MPPVPVHGYRRMPRPAFRWAVLTLALGLIGAAQAAPFRLLESTHDGGGAHSQGGRFSIEGTAGQPDAGRAIGQRFAIQGGFWRPATPVSDTLFRHGFEN